MEYLEKLYDGNAEDDMIDAEDIVDKSAEMMIY